MSKGWIASGLIVSLIAAASLGHSRKVLAAGPATVSKEVREFEVLLKGKPTGTTKFTIEQFPDGRTVVATDALVRVNMVVFVYTYEFHGVETWVGDRLASFQSQGSDGGKKFAVSGSIDSGNCQLTVNHKKVQRPAFVMTSNYWRLPVRTHNGQALAIVDASTGVSQSIRVGDGLVGRIPLGDQEIPAAEYRLTGDVDVKLWLDAQGRIVHQQSIEQGYPTQLRLTRISRNDAAAATVPEFTADRSRQAGPASGVRK
jgi:hypothetical protein